jgi:hypothetical protein
MLSKAVQLLLNLNSKLFAKCLRLKLRTLTIFHPEKASSPFSNYRECGVEKEKRSFSFSCSADRTLKNSRWPLTLLTAFLVCSTFALSSRSVMAGEINQNSTELFGDYTVHYSVFNSTFILPEIAVNYSLVRADNQALINITVQDKQGKAIAAKLEGYAQNLLQQRKNLEFKTINEQDAIYGLAAITFTNEEIFNFAITIKPPGAPAFILKFTRKLYTD